MLPGYSSRNRHSQVNTPSGSYISSPTESSRNSVSTSMLNGGGHPVTVSPANTMSSSIALSPAGISPSSHPFHTLVTPQMGRTTTNGSLPPPVPVSRSRFFRFTPSENGFSPGLLPGAQVSNVFPSNAPQVSHNIPLNINDNSGYVHQVSPAGSPSFYPMSSVHSSEHSLNMHPQFFHPGQNQGFSNTPFSHTVDNGYVHHFDNDHNDNVSLSASTINTTPSLIASATASQVFAAQAASFPQASHPTVGCHYATHFHPTHLGSTVANSHHSVPISFPIANSHAGHSHSSHFQATPSAPLVYQLRTLMRDIRIIPFFRLLQRLVMFIIFRHRTLMKKKKSLSYRSMILPR